MNKLLLSMAFLIFMGITLMSQTRVSGVVKDAASDREIYDLSVTLIETGEEVKTDRIGYFQFVDLEPGTYTIRVSGIGYNPIRKDLSIVDENQIDLGVIYITYNPMNETIGVITLTADELDDDESSAQSSVGLLQSSQDVFASTAAYDLGAYWFRVRGYDNRYNDVFFNGIKMNKVNNGRVTFNNWGGLNDITRRPSDQAYGLEETSIALGNIGGVTNFDTRPSMLRKGVSLSYSLTNRSYRNRVMATYNTGLMENGWGVTVSGSRRWAEEGRIEGTFYDAWAYYLGIEKKISDRHTLAFTAFGAPNRRATNSPNTQEVYDLAGKDYNSYWGWQDGKKRSERVRKTHEPIGILTHHWNIGNESKLTTSIAYQFGSDSGTRLDWNRANNPSPTYYRNMPSFWLSRDEPARAEEYRNAWNTGQIRQLNWTDLYLQNHYRNLAGESAAYVLAEDFRDDKTATFSTNFKTKLDSNVEFVAAASYQNSTSSYYRKVADLLGGEFFTNTDDYADGGAGQYDLDNPDRKIRKGDRYEYDYEIKRQYADLFLQTKTVWGDFTWTFGATASGTRFYREGKYRHYQYQDDSKGKSKVYDFWNFGTKSNLLYKIDGRNFLAFNAQYSTYAPTSDEVFPNGRSNALAVPDLKNAQVMAGEFSYILRAPRVKGKATAFYTLMKNAMEKTFGYIDAGQITQGATAGSNKTFFAAQVLSGVEKQYLGTELAIEAQLTTTLTATAVASIGQYTYNNNPNYYLFSDDTDNGYDYFGKSYLKDYKLSNGPQQGYSLGLEYRSPKFWWVGVNGNFLMNNYFGVAPFARTTHFVSLENMPGVSEIDGDLLREILRQQKATDEFMLNFNAGKTFRFGKYFMGVSLTINNVLDNKNYITSGFEQMRIGNYEDALNENYRTTFGPKMWYDQGLSYFLNVYLRF